MNEATQQNRLFDNKKLAALLIPLAVDQLLNSFMGTVDTLVVSNLGSAAISAVSLVDSINILIVQAFFALASGGTVVCSHYLGCGKKEHAQEAARQLVFRKRVSVGRVISKRGRIRRCSGSVSYCRR